MERSCDEGMSSRECHVLALDTRTQGGRLLPCKKLMGMCHWMGSHFQDWIDYNGVTFLAELPEWGRTFSGSLG